MAYVRFWNMLLPPPGAPVGTGGLQLLDSENHPLTLALPGNYYANYAPVPPASYTFTVRRPTDPNNPLKRLPVLLRADTYITILARLQDNQPIVELLDDTIDPARAADLPGRVTVRQFTPGARVKVAANRTSVTDELTFGQTSVLDNLPPQVVQLAMQANIGGVLHPWNTEVDFTSARHATLLVVPDSYGRFRPRVALDGVAPPSTPETGQAPGAAPRPGAPGTPPLRPAVPPRPTSAP